MRTGDRFADRTAAGRALADALAGRRFRRPVVCALPRGGVPVGREVARRLDAPLDVLVVRKVGAPTNPEYALGALGEGGVEVVHDRALRRAGLTRADLAPAIARERDELDRRVATYRRVLDAVDVADRDVLVVDDGVATGASVAAAASVLRARGARRVIVAVPVAAPTTVARLREQVDEVVAVRTPEHFRAVGTAYEVFDQVQDAEVVRLLEDASEGRRDPGR